MGNVTINSPSTFAVVLDDEARTRIEIPAGVSEVDEDVANHWYAKAHGVEEVKSAKSGKPSAALMKTANKAVSDAQAALDKATADKDAAAVEKATAELAAAKATLTELGG